MHGAVRSVGGQHIIQTKDVLFWVRPFDASAFSKPGEEAEEDAMALGTASPSIAPAGYPYSSSFRHARAALLERENEKRQSERRCLHCNVEFHPLPESPSSPAASMLIGRCVNIGPTGVYAILPARFGVTVGQHYRLKLLVGECGPEPGTGQVVTQSGRILRVELLVNANGGSDEVGVAVQLFGHREGVIPMPLRF